MASNTGTFTNFAHNDQALSALHYYLMYIKFGFGRATQDAGIEIRRGAMTRDQAINLVNLYDGVFPEEHVDKYLKSDYILDKSRILKVQKKYSKNLSKDPFILLLDTEVKTTFNLYKQSHTLKMTKVFDYLQDF